MSGTASAGSVTNSGDRRLGELVEELTARLQEGKPIDVDLLAGAEPEQAERLRKLLPALRALGEMNRPDPVTSRSALESALPGGPGPGVLGDFRILREVGRGGMGIVYEAEQVSLGRRVALKVLPFAAALDGRQLQRFKHEAQAAAQLQHTNIVPVYFVGSEQGVHFYAMQFIDGRNLAAVIAELRRSADQPSRDAQRDSTVDLGSAAPGASTVRTSVEVGFQIEGSTRSPAYFRWVARLGEQAATALQHAHDLGIVHRDVKPGNLMLDGHGQLWVTDFGLARVAQDSGMTLTGDLVGTARYMSPEQVRGRAGTVDHRTDVYSLGVTLYEILALRPAFDGTNRQELLQQVAAEEPAPLRLLNRAVPAELETVVLKAMAKVPAERYATARALAEDLRRFLEDRPVLARPPTPVQRLWKWCRRHRGLVAAAMALLVGTVLAAGTALWWAKRRAALEGEVAQALQDAIALQERGNWPEALSAARRADGLLASAAVSDDLEDRVRSRLADLAMVQRLEQVRLGKSALKGSDFDEAGADAGYRRAFHAYGIDVMVGDPREAAAWLQARTIRVELAAALEDWALVCRDNRPREDAAWKALLALARVVDPDPWRNRLREALEQGDLATLNKLADSDEVAHLPPSTVVLLGRALAKHEAYERAVQLLRRAQLRHQADFWIALELSDYLRSLQPPRYEESLRFRMVALALRPNSPHLLIGIGSLLCHTGFLDEGIAACQEAVRLKADYPEAYCNLGWILQEKGRLDEAIATFRAGLRRKPDHGWLHYNLGNALARKGRVDEALEAYGEAVRLSPAEAVFHLALGGALLEKGEFAQALAARRLGHELGSRKPRWSYPSGQWVQQCERLVELDGKLQAILRGERRPADAAECIALTEVCLFKSLYATSVRFYQEAFTAQPGLIDGKPDGTREWHRYNAACMALRASNGQGKECACADEAQRTAWRRQALDWLRSCQVAWEKELERGTDGARDAVCKALAHWQRDSDLAGVREEHALAALPSGEQLAWRLLWSDVDKVLARARKASTAQERTTR